MTCVETFPQNEQKNRTLEQIKDGIRNNNNSVEDIVHSLVNWENSTTPTQGQRIMNLENKIKAARRNYNPPPAVSNFYQNAIKAAKAGLTVPVSSRRRKNRSNRSNKKSRKNTRR